VSELAERVSPGAVPTRAAAAWAAGAAVVALAATGLVLELVTVGSETTRGLNWTPAILTACVAYGVPGAALLALGRAPAVGALCLWIGLCLGATAVLTGVAVAEPTAEAPAWIINWCWIPAYWSIPLLLLLLPDGRLPSRRWRPVAWAAGAGLVALGAGAAVSPYPLDDLPRALAGQSNPLEADQAGDILMAIGAVLFAPAVVLCAVALVLRLKRARGVERDQLKWVALGGVLTVAILALALLAGDDAADVIAVAGMVPLPASVTIAVLRHGMWDVDLVINRSLVYAGLTAIVVGAYAAVVALAGAVVDDAVAGIVGVALVAVVIQPLHGRLQRAVNQLLYGDRDDPAAALRRLGDRLVAAGEPDEVLPAVADTVARALRLPHVAVAVDGGPRAAVGDAGERAVAIELLYQGERVGELMAAPREPGRGFSPADRRALETIGRQVAVAAHAVRLTSDLRRSRERLVLAREEERRRLRRDLHDELGPTLAAIALELDSARELVRAQPDEADATLHRAAAQARDGVAEVRRIVYELRPPTLDDLGLTGALGERARQLSRSGFEATVEAQELGALPAAVEAAAYRIGSEALANAARHSGASRCVLELTADGRSLTLRVIDTGVGIQETVAGGVGLSSMRERAEEMGGAFELRPTPGGGTEVRATLPLGAP
jgi:two-component system, NarL family, sensor kinase